MAGSEDAKQASQLESLTDIVNEKELDKERVSAALQKLAEKEGLPLAPFTVHDLRRTGSTLLNELGFNRDWIEKCLAHEDGNSSRGVYNKAEYQGQRRHMMQEWSDMIDAWAIRDTVNAMNAGVVASKPIRAEWKTVAKMTVPAV